jgi:hypothetical protein
MKKILALAVLLMLLCVNAWAQPTPPATPPSPESLGMEVPEATTSTTAPPAAETTQAYVSTTSTSAEAAAPSTQATTTASTYMVVPEGVSVPNKFYIPYSPSTTASCYYGQWVPMWLDNKGYGPLYTYEWYPDGRLVTQYLANIPYPGWLKMWFYGDAPGWHTLQYYCNGWSNYIYVYVNGGTTAPTQPPAQGCNARIVVSSPYARGYSVYVDGYYKGGDGQNGDPMDGYYEFYVPGGQQHTIKVFYQGGTYQQTKTYYCGSTYMITISSAPPTGSTPPAETTPPVEPVEPTEPVEPVPPVEPGYPTHPIVPPVYPTHPIVIEPIAPTHPIATPPAVPTQPIATPPAVPTQPIATPPAVPTQPIATPPAVPTQPIATPTPTVTPY